MVGQDGEQIGVVPIADAMSRAEAAELDLVEIAPLAKPPQRCSEHALIVTDLQQLGPGRDIVQIQQCRAETGSPRWSVLRRFGGMAQYCLS